MLNRRELGAKGEMTAAAYLVEHGYEILHRNFRCPAGEIDIIAKIESSGIATIVFVEVKLRIGDCHGTAASAVDRRKQRRLIDSALHYLAVHPPSREEPSMRFDVVEILPDHHGSFTLNHHVGAFTADW